MWGSWSETWENLGHPERGVLTSQPRVVHDSSGWWMAYVRGIDGDLEIYVQQRTLKVIFSSQFFFSSFIFLIFEKI